MAESEYKKHQEVCNKIKQLKKKYLIHRNARDSAIMRHIIHQETGNYIPWKKKINGRYYSSDTANILKQLTTKAYLNGRMEVKRELAAKRQELFEKIDSLIEECERKAKLGLPERQWGAVYLKRLKEVLGSE